MTDPQKIPVFVLCGGLGTRLCEQTGRRPKPMVPVGDQPIVWHIMRTYGQHGFRKFVLCLGYKAEVIKEYFLNYARMRSDLTVELATNNVTVHSIDHEQDWSVTLADTGQTTMTGARVALAAAKYLGDAEHFAVTYGDGVTDADLGEEFKFHQAHERVGTVLGVNLPSRFGELQLDGEVVRRFEEKPQFSDNWINGGYFFFRRSFLEYLSTDGSTVLEQIPLVRLADDGQLMLFKHHGFWHCMDTQRDVDHLNRLWSLGEAPWMMQA